MKDLGLLSYFLGLEISHDSSGYFLSHAKYTFNLLAHAGLIDCKNVSTLVDPQTRLTPLDGHLLSDATLYRQPVASLVYLTITHSDIAYAIHIVSQFMVAPCSLHYDALETLLTTVLLQDSTSSWVTLSLPGVARSKLLLLVLIAHNDVFDDRTKHIEIDCHFIRQHVTSGTVRLIFVISANQIAIIFTKAHPPGRLSVLVSKLKLVDAYPP
ncbi:uncharacterized protein LOC114268747 [Camellia sinensis]|uniref:uncharacterized protein LOC114268747 n=1 Tax=Camellia sinensis TaxID=4442 RepID=UPI001036747C|nr:uncharacterized protein LOC114268747 [Camellia sinensis]